MYWTVTNGARSTTVRRADRALALVLKLGAGTRMYPEGSR